MVLKVEDGTSVVGAESYSSVADADTYHTNFNNQTWFDGSIAEKEAALRKATQYLDTVYATRYPGAKSDPAHSLEWPRVYGYYRIPVTIIPNSQYPPLPPQVIVACQELARRVIEGDTLMPDLERGGMIEEEAVGPIRVRYQAGAPGHKTYAQIDAILSRIIGGRTTVALTRG